MTIASAILTLGGCAEKPSPKRIGSGSGSGSSSTRSSSSRRRPNVARDPRPVAGARSQTASEVSNGYGRVFNPGSLIRESQSFRKAKKSEP